MLYTKEMAVEAIGIAKSNERTGTSMASSAKMAREDAEFCLDTSRYEYAIRRARDSISYSLGIGSEQYKTLTAMI